MDKLEKIVCGVDFSEHAASTLTWATRLARWYGAEMTVLYATAMDGPESPPRPLRDWLRASPPRDVLLRELARLAQPSEDAGVKVHLVVAEGNPAGQILEHAEAMEADLIVLGTHGLGGFERLVLGSVTEKVLRKANRPVLSVPLGEAPLERVLSCVDFSPSALAALDWAESISAKAGAELTLVHVLEQLPEKDPPQLAHFNVPEYRRYLTHDAHEQLLAVARQRVPGREPNLIVVSGRAWREIVRVAESTAAGLIVAGADGKGPLNLGFLGSTASHLARTVSCPVLTVRGLGTARSREEAEREAEVLR